MDFSSDRSVHAEELMPLILEMLAAGQTVRNLTFQGCSMMPMLRQGKDTVEICSLPERLKKYDLPVYRGGNGKYVMHRIVDVCEDHYLCLGDNTYHYEKVTRDQMVAVVCAFKRGDRVIRTDAPGYQWYCHIWCTLFPVRKLLKMFELKLRRLLKRFLK